MIGLEQKSENFDKQHNIEVDASNWHTHTNIKTIQLFYYKAYFLINYLEEF